jgi:hypothetical protein
MHNDSYKEDDNDDLNNLNELKNYLINNYNLDVKINIKDGTKNNIKETYFKICFLLILLIFLFLFLFLNRKNKNIIKKRINYLLYIVIIIVVVFLINYLYAVYFYNEFTNNYNFKYYDNEEYKNYLDYKNYNDFNTGDIIQEYLPWYFTIPLILNYKYGHNFIILKFNNKNYVLHFLNECNWPKYVLYIKSKNLEISCLDSYLKNNIYTRYYRLFRTKSVINNNSVFNYLKYFTSKDICFSLSNMFNICDNRYHCMSFILNLLYYLGIIEKFNFNYFIPDKLTILPDLSNKLYDTPIILQCKYN